MRNSAAYQFNDKPNIWWHHIIPYPFKYSRRNKNAPVTGNIFESTMGQPVSDLYSKNTDIF
jgi:hypothetical protein